MRSRLLLILLLLIALLTSAVAAQDRRPVGEFNVGYSLFTDFTTNGHGFNVGVIGNPTSWFGIEGQFDAWFNVGGVSGLNIYSTMAGPRLAARSRSFTPFVHALAGATYTKFASVTGTDFAMKLGGGVDINFGRRSAWRLEANDLMHLNPATHDFNAVTGYVYRWQ